jgi:hypothetical protein
MKKNKNTVKKEVMTKIKSHDIKMKPKIYFAMISILLGVGLSLSVFIVMFFVNIVFFRLRVYAPLGYLNLGPSGIKAFLFNLPLIHLIVSIVGIVLGLKILKRYDVSYRRNFKYIAIFVISAILTFAFFLDKLNIGDKLAANRGIRPLFMHRAAHNPWMAGEVVRVDKNTITIRTHFGDEIILKLSEVVNAPTGSVFIVGDKIRAVGEWNKDVFEVEGIIKGKSSLVPKSGRVKGYGDFRYRKSLHN